MSTEQLDEFLKRYANLVIEQLEEERRKRGTQKRSAKQPRARSSAFPKR